MYIRTCTCYVCTVPLLSGKQLCRSELGVYTCMYMYMYIYSIERSLGKYTTEPSSGNLTNAHVGRAWDTRGPREGHARDTCGTCGGTCVRE